VTAPRASQTRWPDRELPSRARPGPRSTEPGRTTPLPRTDGTDPTLLAARTDGADRRTPGARRRRPWPEAPPLGAPESPCPATDECGTGGGVPTHTCAAGVSWSMPSDHNGRLDDDQRIAPAAAPAREQHPEPTVCVRQPWSFDRALQGAERLAQREDFDGELTACADEGQRGEEQGSAEVQHGCGACSRQGPISLISRWAESLGGTRLGLNRTARRSPSLLGAPKYCSCHRSPRSPATQCEGP